MITFTLILFAVRAKDSRKEPTKTAEILSNASKESRKLRTDYGFKTNFEWNRIGVGYCLGTTVAPYF